MTRNPSPLDPIGELVAVDPALNSPGVALFRAGILVAADRVSIPSSVAALPTLARITRVGADVVRWIGGANARPRALIVEWPFHYPRGKGKKDRYVDPNDLIGLGGVSGAVALGLSLALAPQNLAVEIVSPTPAEWIGQVPKATSGDPWASPRGALVASCLDPDERALIPRKHDAIDAVGLGLWALGRLVSRQRHARPSDPGVA